MRRIVMSNGIYAVKKTCFMTAVLLIGCMAASGLQAAEIRVTPAQPIQAAIDRARNGDVVVVADGIYAGAGNVNLSFRGKSITVKSESGPANCIIQGSPGVRGFIFNRRERPESVLSGFTIRGFSLPTRSYGAAIYIYGASPTIENCILRNNAGGYGAAVAVISGSPLIQNCMIFGNYADYLAGGIFLQYASYTRIINCTIAANQAGYQFGAGIYGRSLYRAMLVNSIVWGNGMTEIQASRGLQVMYCDVQGGYPGSGNFAATPDFVRDDPSADGKGDYHLKKNSPCVDRGVWVYAPDADIDGESRLRDAAPDIGADEVVH
jgi:parallel beta-helix repeat protein